MLTEPAQWWSRKALDQEMWLVTVSTSPLSEHFQKYFVKTSEAMVPTIRTEYRKSANNTYRIELNKLYASLSKYYNLGFVLTGFSALICRPLMNPDLYT